MQHGLLYTLRFLRAYATLVRDPERLDQVFALGECLPEEEVVAMLREDPRAARVLDQPMMEPLPSVDELSELPEGTLGRAYADFMRAQGVTADAFAFEGPNTARNRFRVHMRWSHDLWHVVTGSRTDIQSEVGLQAFYMGQWDGPLPAVIVSGGLLHIAIFHPGRLREVMDLVSEGYTSGKSAEPLLGFDWHGALHRPLVEVRRELGLERAAAA